MSTAGASFSRNAAVGAGDVMVNPGRALAASRWMDPVIALALGATALTMYVRTLYPGLITRGDSPKFQYLGSVLGTAHSPGYPLYVLVSFCFSKLPIGSMAYRMNLLSAVCAAAAVALTYTVMVRLRSHRIVAVSTALGLGFSRYFWTRALAAEVYGLAAALIALVILMAVRWAESGRDRDFYLTIFAFGLSLSNHLVLAAIAPALVIFVVISRPRTVRVRTIAIGALAGLAGFLPYGYIMLRTWQQAAYVEARASTLPQLVDVIFARRFSGYIFSFTPHEVLTEHLPLAWALTAITLGWLGLALVAVGLAATVVQRRAIGALLALATLGIVFLTINVEAETDGFLMTAWVPLWMLAGLGMQAIWSAVGAIRPAGAAITGAALLAIPGAELSRNYRPNDHHQDTSEMRYFAALFRQLPDRAAIVSEYYGLDQAVLYKLVADGAARGRTIELIPNDLPTAERYAKAGYEVFASSNGRASLSPLGFFEPVQLYDAGQQDGRSAAPTPIDMTMFPLFKMTRRVPCIGIGNLGWRDVTDEASDGQLLVRVDNYRPFDSSVVIYIGMGAAGSDPVLVASTGPQAPAFSASTFRMDRPDEKARFESALERDKVGDPSRLQGQSVVRRLEWQVNDQGLFSQSVVALADRPEVAIAKATVDLNNPLRATVCGWAGPQFFVKRTREDIPLGSDGESLLGRGWSDPESPGTASIIRRTTRDDAEVIVPLGRAGRIVVRVRARPSSPGDSGRPSLVLKVNGRALDARAMGPDWQDYEWDIPALRWSKGLNRLTIGGRRAMVSVSALSFEIQPDSQPVGHVR
jgi:hypothetical protein